MDLTDFLLARIAEDEAVAREATDAPWATEGWDVGTPHEAWEVQGPVPPGEKRNAEVVGVDLDRDYNHPMGGCPRRADADHIARHDPARVLAECEAKRLLIEIDGRQAKDKGILAALSLPYADHPDYDEEWRP